MARTEQRQEWYDQHKERRRWGDPLGEVYRLEIVSPAGYVLAVLRGRDDGRLYDRADSMAAVMGWTHCRYLLKTEERQA